MILTDEEIQVVIQGALASEDKELGDYAWMVTDEDRAVAKAQLKKVYKWGNESCTEHINLVNDAHRHECLLCWQSLLEESNAKDD